jgi:hypothetical protein
MADMKNSMIHLENTSLHSSSAFPCLSGGNPGSPFLCFLDNPGNSPSLENTRWDGWRQFCRKCFESGFLSGLSSWTQSSQKALHSQPSFIASRATDGSLMHLKSVLPPWMDKLHAAETLLSFHSATQTLDSFCLESKRKKGTWRRNEPEDGEINI